jgi:adenosine deaminase
MLGYANSYAEHPIKILVENGVPVTINTDDLLIFDSSVDQEYLRLYEAGTLTAEELDQIRCRGIYGK